VQRGFEPLVNRVNWVDRVDRVDLVDLEECVGPCVNHAGSGDNPPHSRWGGPCMVALHGALEF